MGNACYSEPEGERSPESDGEGSPAAAEPVASPRRGLPSHGSGGRRNSSTGEWQRVRATRPRESGTSTTTQTDNFPASKLLPRGRKDSTDRKSVV